MQQFCTHVTEKSYLKSRNWISKPLSASASERDFLQGRLATNVVFHQHKNPVGWYFTGFLTDSVGKTHKGTSLHESCTTVVCRAPGLYESGSSNSGKKRRNTFSSSFIFLPLQLSQSFCERGQCMAFHGACKQSWLLGQLWQVLSRLSNKTAKKEVKERGCCTVRYEHDKARLLGRNHSEIQSSVKTKKASSNQKPKQETFKLLGCQTALLSKDISQLLFLQPIFGGILHQWDNLNQSKNQANVCTFLCSFTQ